MPLEVKKKHTNITGQPLVSIITPLYNAAPFIVNTIASVQKQTYPNWELIVIDDNSTDNSLNLAENAAKTDSRIKVFHQSKNSGAAVCRNRATRIAKGDFIAFLDADDLWAPTKLQKQIEVMQRTNNPVCFSSYVHIDASEKLLRKRIKALPQLPYRKQHVNNYIGNLTGIYNAVVLGKIYAPKIRKRQDWALWLLAIEKSGKPAIGVQEDLAYYRIHEGNMSADKWKLVLYNYKFYKDFLGYSTLKSIVWLLKFFKEYFFERTKLIERY